MSNAEIIRSLKEAMSAKQTPTAYDSSAVVTRIEGNATAWVKIAGSDAETPVKLTIDAKAGDTVQVRVGGGSAWLTGNQTAPPTDDTTAIEVKQKTEAVERTVETTVQTLEKVADVANDAKDTAREGKAIAEATDQYFWADTNGAHVAITPKGTDPNGATGFNSLWNMLGLLLRNGGNILAQFGQNGIAFYDGSGNNAANVLASFGTSGVRVGKSGQTNIQVAPAKVRMTAPNGSVALEVLFEQTSTDSATEYGVRITDENNRSNITIAPSPNSDGSAFTDKLDYSASMDSFSWQTSGARLQLDSDGVTIAVGNDSTQFNNDGSISINGKSPIYYEDASVTVSFAAGTIGTRGATVPCGSTLKTGYTFITAFVLGHQNTTRFKADVVGNDATDTVNLIAYRATTAEVENASVLVRKIWACNEVVG